MRKSPGEQIFNSSELNKILPSYLINEVKEDNKRKNSNEETEIKNFINEKVSKIFLYN